MRGLLLSISLGLALGVTVAVLLLASDDLPAPEPEAGGGDSPPALPPSPPAQAPEPSLRPHQTTATLVEDLRDALTFEPDALRQECLRVSEALRGRARWCLLQLAPAEASPRVRGLVVFAAGLHLQDDPDLGVWLEDPAPVVRSAAAAAIGYQPGGGSRVLLLGHVPVPVGRLAAPGSVAALERLVEQDRDGGVRETAETVLSAAGLSRPR